MKIKPDSYMFEMIRTELTVTAQTGIITKHLEWGCNKGNEGSATVNFMRNFLALSKDVAFHPCASAQGRDSKEDEGVRGRRKKGRETISRARALRSFLSSDIGILFRRLGLGIG